MKVTFAVCNLSSSHTSGNTILTTLFLLVNRTAHIACNINGLIETDDLFKVIVSHVHWKSGDILETAQDRDAVTADHNRKWYMAYQIMAIPMA